MEYPRRHQAFPDDKQLRFEPPHSDHAANSFGVWARLFYLLIPPGQPWHFVVVTKTGTRTRIREAAEAEEHEFYTHRASKEWLDALAPLGTNEEKPFLESASCLIAIFLKKFSYTENGTKLKNYYPAESVGIASGLLIAALHYAGVAMLTHTPSPMRFLNEILERPKDERPYLLLVAGFPTADAAVPDISRYDLKDIATFLE